MRKEKVLKIMSIIIMGTLLFAMATNVFALSDDDLYLDLSNTVNNTNTDTSTNTNTNVNTNTNTNVNTGLNTNVTNTSYNTNLPHAGVKENTMLGVGITILAISSVYAYRKFKYYKDI